MNLKTFITSPVLHYVEKLDFFTFGICRLDTAISVRLQINSPKGGNNVLYLRICPFANLLLRVSVFQLPFIAHILYGLDLRLDPGQFRRQAV